MDCERIVVSTGIGRKVPLSEDEPLAGAETTPGQNNGELSVCRARVKTIRGVTRIKSCIRVPTKCKDFPKRGQRVEVKFLQVRS
jgi:hypothetical protein